MNRLLNKEGALVHFVKQTFSGFLDTIYAVCRLFCKTTDQFCASVVTVARNAISGTVPGKNSLNRHGAISILGIFRLRALDYRM